MPNSVVHFEIIGKEPAKLRAFYSALFDWTFDTDHRVAPEISTAGQYGFITPPTDAGPAFGGIGGGREFAPHFVMYVGVSDVAAALQKAVQLGGSVRLKPVKAPTGLVVAQFADPEGNVVGLAGKQ